MERLVPAWPLLTMGQSSVLLYLFMDVWERCRNLGQFLGGYVEWSRFFGRFV